MSFSQEGNEPNAFATGRDGGDTNNGVRVDDTKLPGSEDEDVDGIDHRKDGDDLVDAVVRFRVKAAMKDYEGEDDRMSDKEEIESSPTANTMTDALLEKASPAFPEPSDTAKTTATTSDSVSKTTLEDTEASKDKEVENSQNEPNVEEETTDDHHHVNGDAGANVGTDVSTTVDDDTGVDPVAAAMLRDLAPSTPTVLAAASTDTAPEAGTVDATPTDSTQLPLSAHSINSTGVPAPPAPVGLRREQRHVIRTEPGAFAIHGVDYDNSDSDSFADSTQLSDNYAETEQALIDEPGLSSGIIEAFVPTRMTTSQEILPHHVSQVVESDDTKWHRRLRREMCLVCLLLLIAVVVTVVVLMMERPASATEIATAMPSFMPSQSPSTSPSMSPTSSIAWIKVDTLGLPSTNAQNGALFGSVVQWQLGKILVGSPFTINGTGSIAVYSEPSGLNPSRPSQASSILVANETAGDFVGMDFKATHDASMIAVLDTRTRTSVHLFNFTEQGIWERCDHGMIQSDGVPILDFAISGIGTMLVAVLQNTTVLRWNIDNTLRSIVPFLSFVAAGPFPKENPVLIFALDNEDVVVCNTLPAVGTNHPTNQNSKPFVQMRTYVYSNRGVVPFRETILPTSDLGRLSMSRDENDFLVFDHSNSEWYVVSDFALTGFRGGVMKPSERGAGLSGFAFTISGNSNTQATAYVVDGTSVNVELRIFSESIGEWILKGDILSIPDVSAVSLSLSNDGLSLAVGTQSVNDTTGEVIVYTLQDRSSV